MRLFAFGVGTFASVLLLLTAPGHAGAQVSPPAVAPAPAATPKNLADALALARPGEPGMVALSVGAEKRHLPLGAALTNAGATHLSPPQMGRVYGRAVHRFGSVDTLAPPVMTVLNRPPLEPRPWADAPPEDILKILAATFSPAQWQALLGERGIGLGDLTDNKQRDLFRALLPGKLRVQYDVPDGPNRPEDIRDMTASLSQARLRIGSQISLGLPVPGEPDTHIFGMTLRPPDAPHRYVLPNDTEGKADRVDGATVQTIVPNRPKAGQLDTNAAVLQTPVSVIGVQTVAELIARIARATGVEIIADHRHEVKTVTFAGAEKVAPAGDLLRGLAFCVTGTYRLVGDKTWVLTDDIIGAGTRRQMWEDFETAGNLLRKPKLDAAGEAIFEAQPNPEILPLAEPLMFSKAQSELMLRKQAKDLREGSINSEIRSLDLPFAQLTPAQQESARRSLKTFVPGEATLDGTITVQMQSMPELIVPGVDGPVNLNFRVGSLFDAPAGVMQKQVEAAQEAEPAPVVSPRRPPTRVEEKLPDLVATLAKIPRRAVYAHVETTAELDTLIASMQTLGLNELWLDVFGAQVGPEVKTDLLAYAVKTAKGKGIRVWAVCDLFAWKASTPPAEAVDLDIRGETSAQGIARQEAQGDTNRYGNGRPAHPVPVVVSPLNPRTETALKAAMQAVTSLPGIAGVVWREVAPPGYLGPTPEYMPRNEWGRPLGYTDAMRLAFLRQAHCDPVDLFHNPYPASRANLTLPRLDDPALEPALDAAWTGFCLDKRYALLRRLRQALPIKMEVLVEVRPRYEGGTWYGSWEGVDSPFPHADFQGGMDEPADAHRQAKGVLKEGLLQRGLSRGQLASDLQEMGPWDGVVLNTITPLTPFGIKPAPGENPLADLLLPMPPVKSQPPAPR